MASAGGTWMKVGYGPVVGKTIFVPAGVDPSSAMMSAIEKQAAGKSFGFGKAVTGYASYLTPDFSHESLQKYTAKQSAKESASPKLPGGEEKFYANAKTWSTGTKSLDLGEKVTVIQKVNGKILVKEADYVTPGSGVIKDKWTEHASLDDAMQYAESVVAQKQGKAVVPPKPATAAPQTSGKSVNTITEADFAAAAKPVDVISKSGNKFTVDGVDLGNGYMITKSTTSGKYYVVEKEGNKTVSSSFQNINDAYTFAKANTPYYESPPDLPSSYRVFKDKYVAEQALASEMLPYYQKHSVENGYNTPEIISAFGLYQDGGYSSINSHLWHNTSPSTSTQKAIKAMDKAFEKAATPYDLVSVRSKGQGSDLYNLAATLNVGSKYIAKGFDSSALHYNNNWGGGSVRLVYRVPKGTPAIVINGLHGNAKAYSGENELLFARNLVWNVVGKKVSGGNIEVYLEYAGRLE